MLHPKQLFSLAICLTVIFTGCKKAYPDVNFKFKELSSHENSIYFVCEAIIAADKYDLQEVGVIWGLSPNLSTSGTEVPCGNSETYSETVVVAYGQTYYIQQYAIIDGERYLGKTMSIATDPAPLVWQPTAGVPAEVCTQIAVSPDGIIHVFGEYGRQYYSTDEGATWIKINHINSNYLSEPTFIDENVMYVWADDAIRKSTNGGLNWTQIASPSTPEIGTVFFYDATTIFCSIMDTVYRSNNSGATWTGAKINAVEFSTTVSGIHFFNSSIGYAITYAGEVAKTIDGGASWTLQTTQVINASGQGRQIYAVTETHLMAATDYTLYYSYDSGVTWEFKANWTTSGLAEIDFCDASNGIAVFSGGVNKMVRTSDGGVTWKYEFLPNYVSDVEMVSPTKAYAAKGVTGVVYVYE